jgi:hypothetical protein
MWIEMRAVRMTEANPRRVRKRKMGQTSGK